MTTLEITFKTIDQKCFKINFEPTTKISDVKTTIQSNRPEEDFEIDRQKLIYNGKVLEDSQTIGEVNVDPKKFVIVMVSRKKPVQASEPEPTKAEPKLNGTSSTSAPSAPAAVSATVDTSAAPTAAAAAPPSSSTSTLSAEHNALVDQIMAMGYNRADTVRALQAAFFNADRAVEYLCSEIPETLPEDPADGAANESAEDDEGGDPLNFLRNSQEFNEIRQITRENPQMLQQIIGEIANTNPNLMEVIRNNQQAFLDLLNSDAEVRNAERPEQITIAITASDRAAIDRLKSMGFDEEIVIEAYFACEKNEDMAVNYILARMEAND